MKKIIPIWLLFFLSSAEPVTAQSDDSVITTFSKYHNELSVGYGMLSADMLLDGKKMIGEPTTYKVKGHPGAISFTYKYSISTRCSIGIAATYEHDNGIWQQSSGQQFASQTTTVGSFKRTVITIAPEFYYTRCDETGLIREYVFIAIGVTYRNQIDEYDHDYYYSNNIKGSQEVHNNSIHFNGQITPAGVSIGRRLRGFLEFGFGYKGVFHFGCSFRM